MMTSLPHGLKNPPNPRGETIKGFQGKKYRVSTKGEKNATPRPPFVMVSRRPWVDVSEKKKSPRNHHGLENLGTSLKPANKTKTLKRKAKKREWENPRCPKTSPYRQPKKKESTSASGKIEQTTENIQNFTDIFSRVNVLPRAKETTTWVTAEAIPSPLSYSLLPKFFPLYRFSPLAGAYKLRSRLPLHASCLPSSNLVGSL
jgi:hypothetical protein